MPPVRLTIAEYAEQIATGWPPLTAEQKAELSRILSAALPKPVATSQQQHQRRAA